MKNVFHVHFTVAHFFRKKDESLFFPTVISSGNVFSTVITSGNLFRTFITSGNLFPTVITSKNKFPFDINIKNMFPLVITVQNKFPLLITLRKNNGSSFFLKKRGTSDLSSLSHRNMHLKYVFHNMFRMIKFNISSRKNVMRVIKMVNQNFHDNHKSFKSNFSIINSVNPTGSA